MERVVVCIPPSSKIHVNGNGWFNLTTIQVEILDDADTALLAVHLDGNSVYIINFRKLRNYRIHLSNFFQILFDKPTVGLYNWNINTGR